MKRPILLLMIFLISLSCKKTTEGDAQPLQWNQVLSNDEGTFGDIEIIGNDVYVLWTVPLPELFSAKTRVYKSTNGGRDFGLLPYDQDELYNGIAFMDQHYGLLSGYRLIATTTDAGQTWDTTGMGLINFSSFYILNTRIIGYGTGIYISDDTARTWANVQPSGYFFNTMDFADDQTGFAASSGGSFYMSSDAGNSWQEVCTLDDADFYQVDFIDQNKGIAIVGIAASPHAYPDVQLLFTDDGGGDWTQIELESHGIILEPESCCVFRSDKQIYLGDIYGIHFSADMGNTWVTQYTDYPDLLWVRDIKFGAGFGIATTAWMKVLRY